VGISITHVANHQFLPFKLPIASNTFIQPIEVGADLNDWIESLYYKSIVKASDRIFRKILRHSDPA